MLGQIDPSNSYDAKSPMTMQKAHALYPTQRFRKKEFRDHRNYFRITVVRDPLQRLLSVYTNRVVGLKDLHNSPKLRKLPDLTPDPEPDFFFWNLVEYRKASSVIRHHVLPTSFYTGGELYRYDRIYRTREIDELSKDLSDRTGQTVVVPRLNKSEARLSLDDLAPKTQAFLRGFLAEEYVFLSDYFDNPFD